MQLVCDEVSCSDSEYVLKFPYYIEEIFLYDRSLETRL